MSEITTVLPKAFAIYDQENASYLAAQAATGVIIQAAGFEQGEFSESKLVVVYAMVSGRDALSILSKHYTPEKFFLVICLQDPKDVADLPANIWWVGKEDFFGGKVVAGIYQEAKTFDAKISLAKGKALHLEVPVVNTVGTSGKQILLVDDSQANRDRAKEILSDHNLTIASSYSQAMELLGKHKYDVVLTDLYLPVSAYHLDYSIKCADIGKLVPYGLLIANEAKRRCSLTAIVTDAGHHADPFSAAFDEGGDKAGVVYDNDKDWQRALNKLLS